MKDDIAKQLEIVESKIKTYEEVASELRTKLETINEDGSSPQVRLHVAQESSCDGCQ